MSKYRTDKTVELQGKEYILFEGLLECAHENEELKSIETEMIQFPTDENGETAVCFAKVSTKDGRVFTGYGDASPENVNRIIVPHIIRMAETRAIARALRFLTGFGTVFEELGEVGDALAKTPKPSKSNPASPAQINKIKRDAESLGIKMEEIYKRFGIAEGEDLQKGDASNIIRWLIQEKKARPH